LAVYFKWQARYTACTDGRLKYAVSKVIMHSTETTGLGYVAAGTVLTQKVHLCCVNRNKSLHQLQLGGYK